MWAPSHTCSEWDRSLLLFQIIIIVKLGRIWGLWRCWGSFVWSWRRSGLSSPPWTLMSEPISLSPYPQSTVAFGYRKQNDLFNIAGCRWRCARYKSGRLTPHSYLANPQEILMTLYWRSQDLHAVWCRDKAEMLWQGHTTVLQHCLQVL